MQIDYRYYMQYSIPKPKTTARGQLFLAGTMWLIVGIVLYIRALGWLFSHNYGVLVIVFCLSGATLLGLLKGNMALDKVAEKATSRIRQRGDDACLFGFFSLKSWFLIGFMIAMGKLLRMSSTPVYIVSILYMAIGIALTFSSRIFFTSMSL